MNKQEQTAPQAPAASPAEDAAMIAAILAKAKTGSVDHAKLLADRADYAPQGVFASVHASDLEAVLATMTEKAEAGEKGAARLLPKLQKALDVIRKRMPVTRG